MSMASTQQESPMQLNQLDCTAVTLARLLKRCDLMLAVGTGDPAWTYPQPLTGRETALAAPAAMVRPRFKEFVMEDPEGDIVIPGAVAVGIAPTVTRWRVSAAPTRHLCLMFKLDYVDGPTLTLREEAVYIDPVLAASVPPGRTYIPWADVADPGMLLGAERGPPLLRAYVEDTIIHIL
jgi:hypothetical protein